MSYALQKTHKCHVFWKTKKSSLHQNKITARHLEIQRKQSRKWSVVKPGQFISLTEAFLAPTCQKSHVASTVNSRKEGGTAQRLHKYKPVWGTEEEKKKSFEYYISVEEDKQKAWVEVWNELLNGLGPTRAFCHLTAEGSRYLWFTQQRQSECTGSISFFLLLKTRPYVGVVLVSVTLCVRSRGAGIEISTWFPLTGIHSVWNRWDANVWPPLIKITALSSKDSATDLVTSVKAKLRRWLGAGEYSQQLGAIWKIPRTS